MTNECSAEGYSALFSTLDYVVCIATLLVSAAIGVFYAWQGRRTVASTSDVLMGGRKMGTFPAAMSLIASFMSAVTLLGNPAEMYKHGTQFIVIGFAYLILTPVTAFCFMPVFHNLALTSAYEYLARRFSNAARLLGGIIFTAQMVLYMPIVVYAPALAFNQVTGIDTYLAVCATFFVCIFYTSIGGMKAVMWTDAFQTLLMFGGMLAVVARGTVEQGGFDAVWTHAIDSGRVEFFNLDVDPTTRHTFWSLVIGGTFMWGSIYAANQAQIQRYLSVPTVRQARNAIWINCAGLISLLFICCWGGLVMYAKYLKCDPLRSKKIKATDQLMPLFVMETMADLPGVPGLFVAGIFSGALSTVSTGLSALSAIMMTDFLPGCCGVKLEDARAARLSKWISVGFGLLCLALVFVVAQLGAVLQAAFSVFGMVGGPMFGLFSLGLFVPWANNKGALVGTLLSLGLVLWLGIGAQVAAISGLVVLDEKPTSVIACNCTISAAEATLLSRSDDDVSRWYKVSYMWYAPLAWLIVMVVGCVVSFATTPQDPSKLDRALLSPLTLWVLDQLPSSWQQKIRWTSPQGSNNINIEFEDKIFYLGKENFSFQKEEF